MAVDRQTPTIANTPGGVISGADYSVAVNEEIGALWARTTLLLTSVAGTNTITAVVTPAQTAYAANNLFILNPAGANTGATTLNVNALGARNIFWKGAALVGGELQVGRPVLVWYDGTQFNILTALRYESLIVACSDEVTPLVAGTNKITFRMPFGMYLLKLKGSLTTAQPSGATFTVDVNKNGATIITTKLTIDNTEKTSKTAAVQPVISVPGIAEDDEMTIDLDAIGASGAAGLKVTFSGLVTVDL